MRKLLFIALLTTFYCQPILSQTNPIFLGVYFGFKEGVNAVNTPDGRRNGFAFNSIPDAGIKFEYPLGSNSSISLYSELGYSNYSFIIKESKSSDNTQSFKHHFSYLSLTPGIIFDIINIGISFGLPISANYGPNIDLSTIGALVQVNAGANINLYSDDFGSLKLNIQAGYMLTGIFKDYGENDPLIEIIPPKNPQIITNEFNPRVASLMLGLSFVLNMNNIFQ